MRRLAWGLLALAVFVGAARLLTGIVYLSDEPTALLVLKRGPAAWIERPEAPDTPISEQIVLDREEPRLVYDGLYVPVMRSAPVLVPVLAGAALLLLARSARRPARRRS